ncbi:hypothetical protein [Ectothiorhodospira shaposhnikovii]|nr:hypothetical protein [Ectothiorhodospira shaposhnikovii]MCG5511673.1 hypothetical protein [Ectothiorhodospira shaposhnikovii]
MQHADPGGFPVAPGTRLKIIVFPIIGVMIYATAVELTTGWREAES